MEDQTKAALAAAVAAGYVLGRAKKGRLALTGAALVMGRSLEPRQLLIEGVRRLREVPAVGAVTDQLRGEVYQAARNAAGAAVTRRLGGPAGGREDSGSGAEDQETEAADEQEAEPDEGAEKRKAPARQARKAPARKPAAGKPPAKKGTAKPAAGAPHGAGRTAERRKKKTDSGRASSTRSRSGR